MYTGGGEYFRRQKPKGLLITSKLIPMSLLQIKRYNVFHIDLEKEELKIPTTEVFSDGARMRAVSVYKLSIKKLKKLEEFTELVIITFNPTQTVFIYGKGKTKGNVPATAGVTG